jgi:hypothetical protein
MVRFYQSRLWFRIIIIKKLYNLYNFNYYNQRVWKFLLCEKTLITTTYSTLKFSLGCME